MIYYVEREEASAYRRIFRVITPRDGVVYNEVANFHEFESNGDRTRWYHFTADVPWHATPIEIVEEVK